MLSDATYFGSVVSLWCYPVKSMQGEEFNGAALTERGVLGDRVARSIRGSVLHHSSRRAKAGDVRLIRNAG